VSEKKPTLVLTGASGFIGRHLADYFVQRDWTVIAFVRIAPEKHPRNILYIKHDLLSDLPASLPDEIDVFIHAGFIKQENGNDAFALNVKAAENLLDGLQNKKTGQKIFISSLSADKNAASVYGRQKAAIEELFLKRNGTVINAGLVLGDGGLFASMRNYLKTKNKIPLFGKGDQPLQTIYIDDLVLAIDKIVSKKLSGKFVLACDEPVAYREFYAALAKSLGVEPKFVRAPYWLAGFGITMANLLGKKLPVTKESLLGLKLMKKIPSSESLKKIGIQLRDYKASFSELR
jgi:nucleoside-diphosphate-sugar epimerase